MSKSTARIASLPGQLLGAASFFALLTLLGGISWPWAVLIMASLVIHESGHAIVARWCGVPVEGMMFMPAGMVAKLGGQPSARAWPPIALAGPVIGMLPAGIAALAYLATGDARCAGFAGAIAMLNLFNLLPIKPMDGGRVVYVALESLSPLLALAYATACCALIIPMALLLNPFLLILLFFALPEYARDAKRIVNRQVIVRVLAKRFGTARKETAIIAARQARLAEIVMADAKGTPLAESDADKAWDNADAMLQRKDESLDAYLAEPPDRLSKKAAFAWLVVYVLCAYGIYSAIMAADGVMSAREFYGVMLHH